MASQVPDHEAACAADDSFHLDLRHRRHHALALLLRPGGGVRGPAARPAVPRRLAQPPQRGSLLRHRQPGLLLHPANGAHHDVLHPHLD